MTSVRVCYVANCAINFALEGHNIASVGIIQAAIQSGIDAQVVTLEKSQSSSRQGFYPIKTLSERGNRTSYFPSVGELMSSVPAMFFTKALDCDIIHLLNVTKEIFSAIRMPLRIKTPCIAHLYHSYLPFLSYTSFKFRLLLIKLGIFDHIFSSNTSLTNYLTREGLSADRIHYVPYPVDVEKFKPRNKGKLRETYGFLSNTPVISYVGSIDPNRGFFTLLKAFKEVLKEFPQALLHICHPGRKGDDYLYVPFYQFVHQKFGGRIIIQGPNPLIEEVYSLASVVALPFEQPYWIIDPPVVLLEAMASATPIVTTPLGSIGEIGKDGENMIFSDPRDPDSLSKAIKYALRNQDEAEKIGLNAREVAKTQFSQEVVGKMLKRTYTEILEC